VADLDGDGVVEILLGPVLHPSGKDDPNSPGNDGNKPIVPMVVYTWSPEKNAYVGPSGGNDQPFKRISPSVRVAELDSFCRGRVRPADW